MGARKDVRLCRAIRSRDFKLLFQPIVVLDSGIVYGYEALTRGPAWLEDPQKLFRAASRNGLLGELEMGVCSEAVASALRYFSDGERLFVNLSPETSREGGVMEALGAYGGDRVVVEVTEYQRVPPLDFEASAARWREKGFRIAVDDVSAGYSRLMAIALLKPDFIKADRPLVAGAVSSSNWRLVLQHVVALSGEIGAEVIAEGIETVEEMSLVKELGIKYGQGYLFARPAPLAEAQEGRCVIASISGGRWSG